MSADIFRNLNGIISLNYTFGEELGQAKGLVVRMTTDTALQSRNCRVGFVSLVAVA